MNNSSFMLPILMKNNAEKITKKLYSVTLHNEIKLLFNHLRHWIKWGNIYILKLNIVVISMI